MNRNLGELGEKIFDYWASSVGAISQPPGNDQTGWDRLVEIKPETWKGPIDKRPGVLRAYVQIKSTDSRSRKRQIKLSNLESLVKTPQRAFYLFYEFDGKDEVQSAFLVHVDSILIQKVLKRLRKADADGKTDIHKMSMTIKYGEENKLEAATAVALFSRIVSFVGDICGYEHSKLEAVKKLGYESVVGHMKMQLELPEDYSGAHKDKVLVDMALGLSRPLDATNGRFFDERFGIRAKQPENEFDEAQIIFRAQPTDTCHVMLSGSDNMRVEMKGNLYTTIGLSHIIDEDSHAIRIETKFVDFIFSGRNLETPFLSEFKFDAEEALTLDDTKRLLRLLQIIGLANEAVEPLQLSMRAQESNIPKFEGAVLLDLEPKTSVNDLASLIQSIVILADHAFLDSSELVVLEQLFPAKDAISMISKLIDNGPTKMEVKLVGSELELQHQEYIIVEPVFIHLSSKVIVGLVGVQVHLPVPNDDVYIIEEAEVRLLALAQEDKGSVNQHSLKKLAERKVHELGINLPMLYKFDDLEKDR